jgi:L-ascorbate metabolism protein UlaG (beta-lactamase superfamily)
MRFALYGVGMLFGLTTLLFLSAYMIDHFYLSGKVYRGSSPLWHGERFVMPDVTFANKRLGDVLSWTMGERKNVPWNEPYGTGTIAYTPFDTTAYTLRSTFINHATVLIESTSTRILTDPVFSKRASPFSFIGPARHHDPYLALTQIPHLEYVVISHAHYDHLSIPSVRMIEAQFSPHYVVPLNNAQFIMRAGVPIERITELDLYETYTGEDGTLITLERAKHWSARSFKDRSRYLWGSFVIQLAGKQVFFAGDTGYGPHFKKIVEAHGTFDLALLPIGAYEPQWFMKDAHMNPKEALEAQEDLGLPPAMGIHFGTFKLTDEGRHDPETDLSQTYRALKRTTPFLVPTLKNGLSLPIL